MLGVTIGYFETRGPLIEGTIQYGSGRPPITASATGSRVTVPEPSMAKGRNLAGRESPAAMARQFAL